MASLLPVGHDETGRWHRADTLDACQGSYMATLRYTKAETTPHFPVPAIIYEADIIHRTWGPDVVLVWREFEEDCFSLVYHWEQD